MIFAGLHLPQFLNEEGFQDFQPADRQFIDRFVQKRREVSKLLACETVSRELFENYKRAFKDYLLLQVDLLELGHKRYPKRRLPLAYLSPLSGKQLCCKEFTVQQTMACEIMLMAYAQLVLFFGFALDDLLVMRPTLLASYSQKRGEEVEHQIGLVRNRLLDGCLVVNRLRDHIQVVHQSLKGKVEQEFKFRTFELLGEVAALNYDCLGIENLRVQRRFSEGLKMLRGLLMRVAGCIRQTQLPGLSSYLRLLESYLKCSAAFIYLSLMENEPTSKDYGLKIKACSMFSRVFRHEKAAIEGESGCPLERAFAKAAVGAMGQYVVRMQAIFNVRTSEQREVEWQGFWEGVEPGDSEAREALER